MTLPSVVGGMVLTTLLLCHRRHKLWQQILNKYIMKMTCHWFFGLSNHSNWDKSNWMFFRLGKFRKKMRSPYCPGLWELVEYHTGKREAHKKKKVKLNTFISIMMPYSRPLIIKHHHLLFPLSDRARRHQQNHLTTSGWPPDSAPAAIANKKPPRTRIIVCCILIVVTNNKKNSPRASN